MLCNLKLSILMLLLGAMVIINIVITTPMCLKSCLDFYIKEIKQACPSGSVTVGHTLIAYSFILGLVLGCVYLAGHQIHQAD